DNHHRRCDEKRSLWIGFSRGLTHYDPHLRKPNLIAPPVMVVRAVVDGRTMNAPFTTVSAGNEKLAWPASVPLRLNHRQSNLRFEFRGLSFRDERDVRFRYRLDGFDRQWSSITDQPFKDYT